MKTEPLSSGGAALPPMPTFAEFYRAINATIDLVGAKPDDRVRWRDPFPWQKRLAEQVATTEQWPTEVGVPTGLGKTACLDIAIWWLASQAEREPKQRTAPTRVWWVVNRRLLVDSTAEHAKAIADALSDPGSAVPAGQGGRRGRRERRATLALPVGRSRRVAPRSDPAARRNRVAHADRSVAPGSPAVHPAHVRLATAVSRLRINPAPARGRCRHGGH